MRVALVGYGKMGKIIEQVVLERGHEVVCIIDIDNKHDFASDAFKRADVAIEFSVPAAAYANYQACFAANVPVVAGTTGWLEHLDTVKEMCANQGQTFFYASNYSIGVNIFFAVNTYLAKLMNRFDEYAVHLTETHHIHKLDAPSGTGITLATGVIEQLDRKNQWTLDAALQPDDLLIKAFREGEVPGTHEVVYESEVDILSIRHEAKSRAGFALGAVLAAEFTVGKKGFLGMNDLLAF